MNRILVITDGDSDLLSLLKAHCDITVLPLDTVSFEQNNYDALCILSGNQNNPLQMTAQFHSSLCEFRKSGKPVFCEFVASIGGFIGRGTEPTPRKRMVFSNKKFWLEGIEDGDLFYGQDNDCIKFTPCGEYTFPVLTYQEDICAHTNIKMDIEQHRNGLWALWWMDKNTLVSSIRLCNFHRARFAPNNKWKSIISGIISFLAGKKIVPDFHEPICRHKRKEVNGVADVRTAIQKGLNWIKNSDILKDDGARGVREGFTNNILAKDGTHLRTNNVRTDCTGEVGGALWFDYLINQNMESKKLADALFKFNFSWMQEKTGEHRGMLRWSEVAWEICYQDDAARAVIPALLSQHFGAEIPFLNDILEGLDYMLKTTGADGIRIPCTEVCKMTTPESWENLKKANSGAPCAHFNSYYHAALLLAYRASKREEYLLCAEKGLSTLMDHYPNTVRETSETEECCRLVFPLAVLYGVTGKKEHYDWLCRVVDDLETRRHSSGGYAEWDTGYTANCSRNHKGECALLANNGDPIADLLYSNNWLPLGFSYAYLITGEERFLKLWCSVASFLVSCQIISDSKLLDGAWARGFDMETNENCGMPHDTGWGPFCIESGWTVAEIIMGLQFIEACK